MHKEFGELFAMKAMVFAHSVYLPINIPSAGEHLHVSFLMSEFLDAYTTLFHSSSCWDVSNALQPIIDGATLHIKSISRDLPNWHSLSIPDQCNNPQDIGADDYKRFDEIRIWEWEEE